MTSVCFYFQMHQPHRLKWFWPQDGNKQRLEPYYFDEGLNEWILHKVAKKCYWPAGKNILANIDRMKGERKQFKVSYSITGTLLEQMERWDPDLLDLYKQMGDTGCCEFICETRYHSLASLFENRGEFIEQVKEQKQLVKDLLGQSPKIFRNTELLYHNTIAEEIEKLGFKSIITEGIERILEGWKSPNYVYTAKDTKLKVLLRNYKLSDDVGYRFSAKWWQGWPLDAGKYADWLSQTPADTINLFMDYETFGEHQWDDTGIFYFLDALPWRVTDKENLEFNTPSEVIEKYHPRGEINVPWYETISWADMERDPSAWLGNHMQHMNFTRLKQLENDIKISNNEEFKRVYRLFQTSDHFYYQCTKGMGDGSVHEYFSHHGNPYDAGLNYHAALMDFREKVVRHNSEKGLYQKKTTKTNKAVKKGKE